MAHILVVENDTKQRLNLVLQLHDEGYQAHGVPSAHDALELLAGGHDRQPDLLLCSSRLTPMSGIDLIRTLKMQNALPTTILITGEHASSEAVAALQMGIYDFIERPINRLRLRQAVRNCLAHKSVGEQVRRLQFINQSETPFLGQSLSMTGLIDQIQKMAMRPHHVLITGETGTGKDLAAKALHQQSNRRNGAFIKLNCSNMPAERLEEELFGRNRGAFFPQRGDRPGLLEAAQGGTLFLDRVHTMPRPVQAKLLRVLTEGKYRRLGSRRDLPCDVRIVAATHTHLPTLVSTGRFLDQLSMGLSEGMLRLPALRDRGGDIGLLFDFYLTKACKHLHIRKKRVDADVLVALTKYSWPGNVRELKHFCERLAAMPGDPIKVKHLASSLFEKPASSEMGLLRPGLPQPYMSLKQFKNQCEKEYIENVLHLTHWNYVEAAGILEIQRTYLHRKVTSLGIHRPNASFEQDPMMTGRANNW